MSKKYLLATDFDQTLCHWNDDMVDDGDKAALRRFREAGNIVAVITGRTYNSSRLAFSETDFYEMDICFCLSGALCVSAEGKVIYDKRADGKHLSELIEYFRNTGARYLAYDVGCVSGRFDIDGDADFPPTVSKEDALHFDSFTSLNAGYDSIETAKLRAAEISELFGDVITPLQNERAVDMPPTGINKAVAAGICAEMYGIDADNVFTVGDNYNDISMVSAYHGCAMENGPDELIAVAERKVHRVRELIDYIMSKDKELN